MDLAQVVSVYTGSNGDATKALYAELQKIGPVGEIAVNVFRAVKTSAAAKRYRKGRGYKTEAYARKDWSIRNLATKLHVEHAQHPAIMADPIKWGWGVDEVIRANGDPHHHVLYLELPTGQVSFHVGGRYEGPDYAGQWDGVKDVAPDRICRWCAMLLGGAG